MRSYSITIVLDIGANSGQYGRKLRELGYEGQIIDRLLPLLYEKGYRAASFEPGFADRKQVSCASRRHFAPISTRHMNRTQDILGVNITAESFPGVLSAIREKLERPERSSAYACATSVHGVVEAQSDPELKKILNNAFINHPDGMPLVKVGKLLGSRQMERMWGPELFCRVCEMTAGMNVAHFFYGGNEGVAEELGRRMQARFPGLRLAGAYCPPFRPLNEHEKHQIIETINQSGADIVWVGLSTPKQEKWIGEFHRHLDVKLLFSVGAAFDYHTGRLKFTPPLFRRMGLEWFYRLLLEPRRLWRRYLGIVPYFLAKSGMQIVRSAFFNQTRNGNRESR